MQTIPQILAKELGKPQQAVENVIALLDQGNTIPFIARYRKEQHGSMDDTALRKLEDRLRYLRNLETRRQEVKSAIDGQGKLTEELSVSIDNAATLAEVEDLYRPYKQKRRTRATIAREKGLEPLAELLLAQAKRRRKPPKPTSTRKRAWRRQRTPCRAPTTSLPSCSATTPTCARRCAASCRGRDTCAAWLSRRRTACTGCTMISTSRCPGWRVTRSWPSIGAKRRASSP